MFLNTHQLELSVFIAFVLSAIFIRILSCVEKLNWYDNAYLAVNVIKYLSLSGISRFFKVKHDNCFLSRQQKMMNDEEEPEISPKWDKVLRTPNRHTTICVDANVIYL